MLSSFYIDKYTEYLRNRNKYKNSLILPQNNQINYRIINTQRPKTKVDDNIISKKSFTLVWNLSLGAQAQGFNSSGRDIALSYSNGLWISVAYSNIGVILALAIGFFGHILLSRKNIKRQEREV